MVARNEAKKIFDAAMKLPQSERTALLDGLLAEFSDETEDAVAKAWASEAEDRVDAIEAGEVELIDGDAILDALRDGRRP